MTPDDGGSGGGGRGGKEGHGGPVTRNSDEDDRTRNEGGEGEGEGESEEVGGNRRVLRHFRVARQGEAETAT